jgi:hypothetical protein
METITSEWLLSGNARQLTHQVEDKRMAYFQFRKLKTHWQSWSLVLPLMHNSTAWTPGRQLIDSECASERKKAKFSSIPYMAMPRINVKGDAVRGTITQPFVRVR